MKRYVLTSDFCIMLISQTLIVQNEYSSLVNKFPEIEKKIAINL